MGESLIGTIVSPNLSEILISSKVNQKLSEIGGSLVCIIVSPGVGEILISNIVSQKVARV